MNVISKLFTILFLTTIAIHSQAREVNQYENWATCYSLTSAIREANGEFWPAFKKGLERETVKWKKAALISLIIDKKKTKPDAENALSTFENAFVQDGKAKKKTEMDLLVMMARQCKAERIIEAENYIKAHQDVLTK